MLELLRPDLYVCSLKDIPLEALRDRGLHGLIIDLDNTVTEWGRASLDPEVCLWFTELKNYDLKACLVSNNRSARVKKVAASLSIPGISRAGKPRRRAFHQAMGVLGTGVKDTAVIGDQVFTDVLGGNRLGLYTVLVKPIDNREFIGTRLMRQVERLITSRLVISDWQGHERNS